MCQSLHNPAKPCKTLQNPAKPCKTLQNPAKPCKTWTPSSCPTQHMPSPPPLAPPLTPAPCPLSLNQPVCAGSARAVWGGTRIYRPHLWGGHHRDRCGCHPGGGVGPRPGGVLHQECHADQRYLLAILDPASHMCCEGHVAPVVTLSCSVYLPSSSYISSSSSQLILPSYISILHLHLTSPSCICSTQHAADIPIT